MQRNVCLIILDGFGVGRADESNPVFLAKKERFFDVVERDYPKLSLAASGISVGLPFGEAGNSETGHLNLGAGFIVYQALQRINMSIKEDLFPKNGAFLKAVEHVKKNDSSLHILGLASSGTVHSALDHLFALMEFASSQALPRVWVHAFTDGRDAPPNEGARIIEAVEQKARKLSGVRLATVIGRVFAMDRDQRWDRTEKAYRTFVEGQVNRTGDFVSYIKESYRQGVYDEFVEPAIAQDCAEESRMKPGDAIIYFDFREDSVRQLTEAFLLDGFSKFKREKLEDLCFVTMTEYEKGLPALVAFPPVLIENPVAKVISDAGLSQFRVGEVDKYAHVTFFFNGMREEPFAGEERELIHSLPGPHYDRYPEMSAHEIRDKLTDAIASGKYRAAVANFANADMVGHTGNFDAIVKAVEVLDECLGKIMETALAHDWALIVTADHGNAELSLNIQTGEPLTEHSTNPVPCYLIANHLKHEVPSEISLSSLAADGILADVAPTMLALMGMPPPPQMTGKNILDIITPDRR